MACEHEKKKNPTRAKHRSSCGQGHNLVYWFPSLDFLKMFKKLVICHCLYSGFCSLITTQGQYLYTPRCLLNFFFLQSFSLKTRLQHERLRVSVSVLFRKTGSSYTCSYQWLSLA